MKNSPFREPRGFGLDEGPLAINDGVVDDVQVGAGCGLPALVEERRADFVVEVLLGGVFVGADARQQIGVSVVLGELAKFNFAGAGFAVDVTLVDESVFCLMSAGGTAGSCRWVRDRPRKLGK